MGHPSACIVEHNISHCTPAPKVTGSPIQIVPRFRTQYLAPISVMPLLGLLSLCLCLNLFHRRIVFQLSCSSPILQICETRGALVALRASGAQASVAVQHSLTFRSPLAPSFILLVFFDLFFPSALCILFSSFLVSCVSYFMHIFLYVSPIICISDEMYSFFLCFLLLRFAYSLLLFISSSHLCSHLLCFCLFLVLPASGLRLFSWFPSLPFLLSFLFNTHLSCSSSGILVVA